MKPEYQDAEESAKAFLKFLEMFVNEGLREAQEEEKPKQKQLVLLDPVEEFVNTKTGSRFLLHKN